MCSYSVSGTAGAATLFLTSDPIDNLTNSLTSLYVLIMSSIYSTVSLSNVATSTSSLRVIRLPVDSYPESGRMQ